MQIVPTELRKIMAIKGIAPTELVRQVNALQKEAGYTKRPMGRQAFYHYMDGHCPPQERLYAIAAILGVHPKRIFGLRYDDNKFKKYKDLISKVGIVPRV